MQKSHDNTDLLLAEMQKKGLASTASGWLEIAIAQRNPLLTVGVAYSAPLYYDRLDKALAANTRSN
ncbi:MAG TPA: hypothetical protein VLH15_04025 [Dehalococcoidales bacterium]|nr:hypothetical protein [Dehalococcoidales bacterium]